MNQEVVILIAEDDEGHAGLIRKNLARAGILNEMLHFRDGQEIVNFLLRLGDGRKRKSGTAYVLLLDIRMPKLDGLEVLARIKCDPELRKLPVIMITTTDNPMEVARCHAMGCNSYITKPVEYEEFVNAIRQLGLFLMVVQVPKVNGD
ncbi:Response regulator receiver domain-containing protein [Desulfonatronum thiosulfatophilum]|uniref:Response regulator receiver domain-containing protein n=1 Tax=Desulfonatronum thiosulfatophilum TaxID=617002 RepID=A0A1G6CD57_9BACT|nr:response regulator [Desulfonatronum thiosulfatophilum]SDB30864.1 Response regulator receiver domain-containing protein [Desulfonatronum thiosulfatophilum]